MIYEQRKHDGSLPIVGVNTFVGHRPMAEVEPSELARGTEEERQRQLRRLDDFRRRHAEERPAAIARLQEAAISGGNVFGVLMDTVRHATLGEITAALFEVGGSFRRTT